VPRPPQRADLFDVAVGEAVERVARHVPVAVRHVTIGIEEVPPPQAPWAVDQVPLAAAGAATSGRAAQGLLFRRTSVQPGARPRGLRVLVALDPGGLV